MIRWERFTERLLVTLQGCLAPNAEEPRVPSETAEQEAATCDRHTANPDGLPRHISGRPARAVRRGPSLPGRFGEVWSVRMRLGLGECGWRRRCGCLLPSGPDLKAYDARRRADSGRETHDGPVDSKEDHSTDQRDDRSQESHPLAVALELDVGFETCQLPVVALSKLVFGHRDDPICSTGSDGLAVAEGCGQRQRP